MKTASVFTDSDRAQCERRGLSAEEAARQLELLRQPPDGTRLERPCTVGDGIDQLAENAQPALVAAWRESVSGGETIKFVPASGAASRMFKFLSEFVERGVPGSADDAVAPFFDQYQRLPFARQLDRATKRAGLDPEHLRRNRDPRLVEQLLTEDGLNFAGLPKGLLPFHRSADGSRLALQDQIAEGVGYLTTGSCKSQFHFTVSPDQMADFRAELEQIAQASEKPIAYDLSVQHSRTDTLASDPSGAPFRAPDGSLLFRPGGHGALIENLGECARPIVVIKNIDNILPTDRQQTVIHWKRLLIGRLAQLRERTHALLDRLEAGHDDLAAAERFLRESLYTELAESYKTANADRRRQLLIDRLDRPIRVCGMVRNEGEPGGGPFWVRQTDGCVTPQIVESAQIDSSRAEQAAIVAAATHFNPVDIVCSLTARDGTPYPLERYIDRNAVFVAEKSIAGRPLRALERPGLWNGAMAGWNSCFVEVPGETFAPVKTVFDLLRPEHQVP